MNVHCGDPAWWSSVDRRTRWIFSHLTTAVAVSSRVRLARNLSGYPFPHTMDESQAQEVVEILLRALSAQASREAIVIRMGRVPSIEQRLLAERHLVSFDFAEATLPRAVVLLPSRRLSIMVNEEDHIRIQAIRPGLALRQAWRTASAADDRISRAVSIAFSPRLGYLTACPTNLGTGLRGSVLLHLPGLAATGQMPQVEAQVRSSGVAIRGCFGEYSEAVGNLFQFSTTRSLGQKEEEILSCLENVVESIIERERRQREALRRDRRMQEEILRTLAEVGRMRQISTAEALGALSLLILGRETGCVKMAARTIREMVLRLLPGHLQREEGRILAARQRDRLRAALLRREIGRLYDV